VNVKRRRASFFALPPISFLRHRFAPYIAFIHARLTSRKEPGLHLTLTVVLFVGAVWLFAGVAEDVVTGDPLVKLDVKITDWFHARTSPFFTRFMLIVTDAHGTQGMSFLTAALALYLGLRRKWYWLLTLVIAVPGGMVISMLLKQLFMRNRPDLRDPILTLASYSFPSGHVVGATLFYGFLAAYLASSVRSWRWQVVLVFSACAFILLVGVTRIYLGVHYFSDVIAAAAAGIAWLALCLIAVDALKRNRQKAHRSAGT
jgi:membrane-associated phospholipid phosphatase